MANNDPMTKESIQKQFDEYNLNLKIELEEKSLKNIDNFSYIDDFKIKRFVFNESLNSLNFITKLTSTKSKINDWVELNYKNTKLFSVKFVKLSKENNNNFVYFENKGTNKIKIPEKLYQKFLKEQPKYIYIIRYPKYKKGFLYSVHPIENFENYSDFLTL